MIGFGGEPIKIDGNVQKQTFHLLDKYNTSGDLFKLIKESFLKLDKSKEKEKWLDKVLKNYARLILYSNKLLDETLDLNKIKDYFTNKFSKAKEE